MAMTVVMVALERDGVRTEADVFTVTVKDTTQRF